MLTRTEQLRDAISRCETRLEIAVRNMKECDPSDRRKLENMRGDFYRAQDDLTWMHKRLEAAQEVS